MVKKCLLSFSLIGLLTFQCLSQQATAPTPDSTRFIKLTAVQEEYERLISEIPILVQKYTDTTLLHSLQTQFEKHASSFSDTQLETDKLLNGYVRSWQIKNIESKLNRAQSNFTSLSSEVSKASSEIETNLLKIKNLVGDWGSLDKRIKNDTITVGLLQQTEEVLALLNTANKLLQGQFAKFLRIQSDINQFQIDITEYTKRIEAAEHDSIVKLFERNANFIWNPIEDENVVQPKGNIIEALQRGTHESLDYFGEKWKAIIWLFILGTSLYATFYVVKKRQPEYDEETASHLLVHNAIIKYPIASSVITILLISFFVLENRPALLSELLLVGFVVPLTIFSFGKSVTSPWVYWCIFMLYCLNVLLLHIPLPFHSLNFLLVGINLATGALLFWMYKNPTKYLSNTVSPITTYIKIGLVPFFFFLSCFTLVAALIGYIELSKLVLTGIVGSIYLGPVILICSLIIRNFIQTLSHTFVFENSFLAKKYLPMVFKLVSIGAFILWFSSVLRVFGVYPFFLQSIENIWNFGGEFGSFHVSVGDIASVVLTIVISFILAGFIQVLLEEELLSRVKVARGIPMAMGVLGKYFVIIIGFFLAIASTGFDLTKMSILAGALGVGVGFGLQNLVANFVSGMILIFERPILVGDIIEAEGVEGQVTQIGIRASKMLTYAGAEVVIPNSNLISNRVSNWTLSNRRRRFIIEIRTSRNADPNKIVATLSTIASQHIHIIKDPAPFVVFEGQVDQSLLFKVYYWQVGELLSTRSDLNLQIYSSLKDQGIEISIPVYEIKTAGK